MHSSQNSSACSFNFFKGILSVFKYSLFMLPANCFDLQMRTDEVQLPHCWTLPRVPSVSVTAPGTNSRQGSPKQSFPIAYKAKSPEQDVDEEKRNPVWLTRSLLYLCRKSSEKVIFLGLFVPRLHASMELAREVSQHAGPARAAQVPPQMLWKSCPEKDRIWDAVGHEMVQAGVGGLQATPHETHLSLAGKWAFLANSHQIT